VWGVGFYPFSDGQLPNFQGKSPGIFAPIPPYPTRFLDLFSQPYLKSNRHLDGLLGYLMAILTHTN